MKARVQFQTQQVYIVDTEAKRYAVEGENRWLHLWPTMNPRNQNFKGRVLEELPEQIELFKQRAGNCRDCQKWMAVSNCEYGGYCGHHECPATPDESCDCFLSNKERGVRHG